MMEKLHGMVDCFDDLWFVVEREDGFWDISKKAVSVTYFKQFSNFNEFVYFLRQVEKSLC